MVQSMISYPVKYNQDDDCVEGSDFVVIARPHVEQGTNMEVYHEIGRLIADALNAYLSYSTPPPPDYLSLKPGPIIKIQNNIYDLPDSIANGLPVYQKKALSRIERKHKKMVAKLIAKFSSGTPNQTEVSNEKN